MMLRRGFDVGWETRPGETTGSYLPVGVPYGWVAPGNAGLAGWWDDAFDRLVGSPYETVKAGVRVPRSVDILPPKPAATAAPSAPPARVAAEATVPVVVPVKAPVSPASDRIVRSRARLEMLNWLGDSANSGKGIMTDALREAIRRFQAAAGLSATGTLDDATYNRINQEAYLAGRGQKALRSGPPTVNAPAPSVARESAPRRGGVEEIVKEARIGFESGLSELIAEKMEKLFRTRIATPQGVDASRRVPAPAPVTTIPGTGRVPLPGMEQAAVEAKKRSDAMFGLIMAVALGLIAYGVIRKRK